jgi:hypothetical protein
MRRASNHYHHTIHRSISHVSRIKLTFEDRLVPTVDFPWKEPKAQRCRLLAPTRMAVCPLRLPNDRITQQDSINVSWYDVICKKCGLLEH